MSARFAVCAAALGLLVAVVMFAAVAGRTSVDQRNAEVAHQTVTHAGLPTGATPGPRGTP